MAIGPIEIGVVLLVLGVILFIVFRPKKAEKISDSAFERKDEVVNVVKRGANKWFQVKKDVKETLDSAKKEIKNV